MTPLAERLVAPFEAARDPDAAAQMRRYMRDQFAFLGIKAPARRARQRQAWRSLVVDRSELVRGVEALWARDEREYQYAACDALVAHADRLDADDLGWLASLVTTKSWWDTVDVLAVHVVGTVVRRDREAGDPVMDRWIASTDLWLARAAVLHQNRWREDTDRGRLFGYCLARAGDRDFFMRKAIGWALRELSRTAPDEVRRFVRDRGDALSPLSKREALKHLDS